jgi:WD40 repeat protein
MADTYPPELGPIFAATRDSPVYECEEVGFLTLNRVWPGGVSLNERWSGSQKALNEHLGAITCVQFSGDGSLLASGSKDGTVRLWETDLNASPLMTTIFNTSEILSLEWEAKNDSLVRNHFPPCSAHAKGQSADLEDASAGAFRMQ